MFLWSTEAAHNYSEQDTESSIAIIVIVSDSILGI